jgi:prolyl 4-hydroxylase
MSALMARVRALAGAGQPEAAIALIDQEAGRGDGEALFVLANWRLWGIQLERDRALGFELLQRAAATGHAEAVKLRAFLLANGGAGNVPDFAAGQALLATIAGTDADAAAQLQLLATMPESDPEPEWLSRDPEICIHREAFSPAECAWLARKAGPALRPSMIRDPVTGQGRRDPMRTSSGMYFDPSIEDLVVRAINLRLARISGTPVACGEMLHILRYAPGEEYRTHIDARPGAPNQRLKTALIYLNDDYTGGETSFPNLGLTVRGRAGDCLVFRNADAEDRPDERMRHAGLPVTSGAKWLASRWIRRRPFDPAVDE